MSNLHELALSIRSTALAVCASNSNPIDGVLFAQLRMIVDLTDQMISELLLTEPCNRDTPAVQLKELTEWYHDESVMDIVSSTHALARSAQPTLAWGAEKQENNISMLPTEMPTQSLRKLFRTSSEQPEVVIEDFPSPELTFALLATAPASTNAEQVERQHRYFSVKSPLALPMHDS